jgi:hypothetical protein
MCNGEYSVLTISTPKLYVHFFLKNTVRLLTLISVSRQQGVFTPSIQITYYRINEKLTYEALQQENHIEVVQTASLTYKNSQSLCEVYLKTLNLNNLDIT